jgi:hypothetical protein
MKKKSIIRRKIIRVFNSHYLKSTTIDCSIEFKLNKKQFIIPIKLVTI